jgi:hypothetical protein
MENIPEIPHFNMLLSAGTALVPLLLGFIWYNPKVFGKAWMTAAGVTPEDGKKMNMPLVFGLTYILGFLMSIFLHIWTIHQFAFFSLLQPARGFADPAGFKEAINTAAVISQHKFRSWSHGLAHGLFIGINFILPIIAINGMFERKNWKYILINWGFWTVSVIIMGMIICQFA